MRSASETATRSGSGTIGVYPLVRVGPGGRPAAGRRGRAAARRRDPEDRGRRPSSASPTSRRSCSGRRASRSSLTVWREGQVLDVRDPPRHGDGRASGSRRRRSLKKFASVAARRARPLPLDLEHDPADLRRAEGPASDRAALAQDDDGPARHRHRPRATRARDGFGSLFFLVAVISLQVGILNLFPLAPLDGGHLAILAGEGVIRRDFSWPSRAGS